MVLDTLMTQDSPTKINSQQSAFINYLAIDHMNQVDAYCRAYPNTSRESARASSTALLALPHISNEIEAIKAQMTAKQMENALEPIKDEYWSRERVNALRKELYHATDNDSVKRAILDDVAKGLPDADPGSKVTISWGD
jgi:hypothetical protein